MNVRTLRYLVALDQHRHFGRAAEACFVSQPTLSTQIKKLEEELGAELVERRHKRVLLTPLGTEIARRARRIVRDCEELVELAKSQQDPLVGQLRLGLIPTLGPYLLPHVVGRLKQRAPQLRCLLYEFQTLEILARLDRGELDAGLLALPVPLEGLEHRVLFDEPFFLAVPLDHALAGAAGATLEEVRGETLLLLDDGHCLRDQALEVCSRADVREAPELRATSLETLRQMVATGLGMTLLPALAVRAEDTVATVPLRPHAPFRRIGLVWRRSNPRGPTLELLAELVREVVRDADFAWHAEGRAASA